MIAVRLKKPFKTVSMKYLGDSGCMERGEFRSSSIARNDFEKIKKKTEKQNKNRVCR